MRTAGRCATYTAGMELWSWLAMAGVGVVGYLLGWAGGARSARRPALPPTPPSGRSIAPPAEVGLEIHDEQRAEIGRLLAQGRKLSLIHIFHRLALDVVAGGRLIHLLVPVVHRHVLSLHVRSQV